MKGDNEIEKLFFKVKPVKIMVNIGGRNESYARKLSKDVGVTYAHTVKILNRMKDYNLISFEPQGRKKIVTFTDDGREIVNALSEAHQKVEERQRKLRKAH